MLEFLKKENEIRKNEEREKYRAVEAERIRLEEERAKQKKSFVRKKIKFVDKKYSEKERLEDEAKLKEFKAKEQKKVNSARNGRKVEVVKTNWPKILIAIIITIAVIVAGVGIGVVIHKKNIEEKYNAAVECIINQDYRTAYTNLEEVDISDADRLRDYCSTMMNLDDYEGNVEDLLSSLDYENEIENATIRTQYAEIREQLLFAKEVQEDIDDINNAKITTESKKEINSIEKEANRIDDVLQGVVDDSKLEKAEETINHLEKKTDVGKTMLAIAAIGTVKLSKKDAISKAKKLYNNLSDEEKEEVVNYKTLKSAKAKLSDLEAAKKAREKKAAEKAKKEREAAKQKKASSSGSSNSSTSSETMVWVSETGNCYHSINNCGRMNPAKAHQERLSVAESHLNRCSKCW